MLLWTRCRFVGMNTLSSISISIAFLLSICIDANSASLASYADAGALSTSMQPLFSLMLYRGVKLLLYPTYELGLTPAVWPNAKKCSASLNCDVAIRHKLLWFELFFVPTRCTPGACLKGPTVYTIHGFKSLNSPRGYS